MSCSSRRAQSLAAGDRHSSSGRRGPPRAENDPPAGGRRRLILGPLPNSAPILRCSSAARKIGSGRILGRGGNSPNCPIAGDAFNRARFGPPNPGPRDRVVGYILGHRPTIRAPSARLALPPPQGGDARNFFFPCLSYQFAVMGGIVGGLTPTLQIPLSRTRGNSVNFFSGAILSAIAVGMLPTSGQLSQFAKLGKIPTSNSLKSSGSIPIWGCWIKVQLTYCCQPCTHFILRFDSRELGGFHISGPPVDTLPLNLKGLGDASQYLRCGGHFTTRWLYSPTFTFEELFKKGIGWEPTDIRSTFQFIQCTLPNSPTSLSTMAASTQLSRTNVPRFSKMVVLNGFTSRRRWQQHQASTFTFSMVLPNGLSFYIGGRLGADILLRLASSTSLKIPQDYSALSVSRIIILIGPSGGHSCKSHNNPHFSCGRSLFFEGWTPSRARPQGASPPFEISILPFLATSPFFPFLKLPQRCILNALQSAAAALCIVVGGLLRPPTQLMQRNVRHHGSLSCPDIFFLGFLPARAMCPRLVLITQGIEPHPGPGALQSDTFVFEFINPFWSYRGV